MGIHDRRDRDDRGLRRAIHPKADPAGRDARTLAGISITFISMRPAAQMWEAAWIGLPVMAIILIGFFTNVKLPFGILSALPHCS